MSGIREQILSLIHSCQREAVVARREYVDGSLRLLCCARGDVYKCVLLENFSRLPFHIESLLQILHSTSNLCFNPYICYHDVQPFPARTRARRWPRSWRTSTWPETPSRPSATLRGLDHGAASRNPPPVRTPCRDLSQVSTSCRPVPACVAR